MSVVFYQLRFTMIRFFLLIGFLSYTCVSREVNPGNCENTILENLAGFINTSSSHLTKEVLTTFFLRTNGESRFNITKERKCKDYGQNYQQFLEKTSLHLSRHTVCGNSYFKISVATLMIFLHLDRYICSEHSEPYQAYEEQINRIINILQMTSRHIHHDRNRTTSPTIQKCLNENKLQKIVDIILSNEQRFQHQHLKRNSRNIQQSNFYTLSEHSSTQTTSQENKQLNTLFTKPTFTTSATIGSESNITMDQTTFTSMKSYFKGMETHCFLGVTTRHPVCIGLNSTFQFTSFYCMKGRESNIFKCAKYKRITQSQQTKNYTFTLVLISSFSNETVQELYRFAEQVDFQPPFERLSWIIKYLSYKPSKLYLNLDRPTTHFDEQDLVENISAQAQTLNSLHMTTTKKPNHKTTQKEMGTPRTHGSARKYQHDVHHHVTEQEVRAALIVYAVIKGYMLQPSDLPCPKDILQSLFSYWGSSKSQYLSMKAIEKKFQTLSDKTLLVSHETHAHKRRSSLAEPRALPLRHNSKFEHPISLPLNNDQQLSKRHENGHSHEHSPDYNHEHFSNPEHNHGHQAHGHPSQCFHLLSPLLNEHREHYREEIAKVKWNLSDIPSLYFKSRTSLSIQDLQEIAPALLLLLLTGEDRVESPKDLPRVTYIQSYGLGTLCVVFLSLASVLGAIFIKITGTKKKAFLLSFLLALSVGCLLGDAILHLVPSTLGFHEHDNQGKLVILLVTMYGFFLIQLLVSLFHKNHDHSTIFMKDSKKTHNLNMTKNESFEIENKARKDETALNNISTEDKQMERQESNESQKDLTIEECPSESNVSTADRGKYLVPAVWMVIIGDCVHNFADGLAIGATFTQSLTEGLSTAIAVLCHEIPHELGDFAILLAAGFSVKKAIVVNLLSSITAFIGLYIGISVGEEFRIWIIAAGAGMFLYISMVTMIPELVRIFRNNTCKEMFFSLNLGYILGVVAMLLLAIYEDHLKIV
ncbi:zinc transporter ZIP12 isoform X1 [Magallana gigas]|uniref:zinc transporter ZIP12 isoform X1 n=1 Tax=Magallana gigas TaxID=29159 RepID=UPI00334089D2